MLRVMLAGLYMWYRETWANFSFVVVSINLNVHTRKVLTRPTVKVTFGNGSVRSESVQTKPFENLETKTELNHETVKPKPTVKVTIGNGSVRFECPNQTV